MRWARILVVFSIALLVILAACSKKECESAADCTAKPRDAFTPACVNYNCTYTPIPNVCGNAICEGSAGENKCTCAQDCGTCSGKVPGTKYLVQKCEGSDCLQAPRSQKPVYASSKAKYSGDSFSIDVIYNTPFNLKKDTFGVDISLSNEGPGIAKRKIERAELRAKTADNREIVLARKEISRPIWTGLNVHEEMILDFPTVEKEAELKNLVLEIAYTFDKGGTQKSGTLRTTYKEKFLFVNPQGPQKCPESCDDGNDATKDICGPQTNYFCKHEPIALKCGNFVCEPQAGENKCTCAQDCGPCAGPAGSFMSYSCIKDSCKATINADVNIEEKTIYDEKNIGPITFANTYSYNNPFDVSKNSLTIKFEILKKEDTVSRATIKNVRVLDRQELLAREQVDADVIHSPHTISIKLPTLSVPEKTRSPVISVDYVYTREGADLQGTMQKKLDKITFIQPG